MLTIGTAKQILQALSTLMAENQDYLIQIDSAIGDGDLGLTMSKAFRTAHEQMADSDGEDVGMLFAKAGMAMAKAAPSTMGSLVATGFMKGGKAVKGKSEWEAADVAAFFRAFSDGVMERGKTQPGNKTIVDVLDPVATVLQEAVDRGVESSGLAEEAVGAAERGEEAARNMTSQHGKAAIYREQTVGKQDPGAVAGVLIVKGFFSVF